MISDVKICCMETTPTGPAKLV